MPDKPPSIRTIAESLGLSRTTVSDALRGRGRVDARTASRVRERAALLNYRPNALAATVMSAMRRSHVSEVRGTIAVVDLLELDRQPHGPFHGEIVAGLRERAGQLGFKLEEFVTGPRAVPLHRLDTILQSRGIVGVVVLPSWYPPDLSSLEWSRYAGVYTDYMIERPSLHSVCVDHYHLMIMALRILTERGYRRPGLLLQRGRDLRIEHRQSAAFRAFQATYLSEEPAVPVLITEEQPDFSRDFKPWFRAHRPDVVLGHFEQVVGWMESLGARIPDTHGVVALNRVDFRRPCAGFDLQGRLIGGRAAELVIGQVLRGELGLPEWPSRAAIQPRWIEGPTVAPAPGAGRV